MSAFISFGSLSRAGPSCREVLPSTSERRGHEAMRIHVSVGEPKGKGFLMFPEERASERRQTRIGYVVGFTVIVITTTISFWKSRDIRKMMEHSIASERRLELRQRRDVKPGIASART